MITHQTYRHRSGKPRAKWAGYGWRIQPTPWTGKLQFWQAANFICTLNKDNGYLSAMIKPLIKV